MFVQSSFYLEEITAQEAAQERKKAVFFYFLHVQYGD